MENTNKLYDLSESLAEYIHTKAMEVTDGEALDGDETKALTDLIYARLDLMNGNRKNLRPDYQTMKEAGYNYMRYLGDGEHLLENIRGSKPYQFEVWFSNKGHASYGIYYKNTVLEFAHAFEGDLS